MVEAAFDFLNREDLPSLPVAVQADCLRIWSRAEAKGAAAHADLVGAFHACEGPRADGQRSTGAWLAKFTRSTPPAARRQVGTAFRIRSRPHVQAALADGAITVSYAQWIGDAVSAFYPEDQNAVEAILVEAAASVADVEDLAKIATVAIRKLCPGGTEREEAQRHTDRGLTLSKTLGGVSRANGDLTAEATALAETVIEALAMKKGPEDTRSKRQRRHDAFADAMRRLVDSGLMPERGGSKPHLKVDMDLAPLRGLPGSKQLEEEWIEQRIAELARRRLHRDETVRELLIDQPRTQLPPAFSGAPERPHAGPSQPEPPGLPTSGQGAILAGFGPISDGPASALSCDSVITPTVLGAVDHDALSTMTEEWLSAHRLAGCPGCTGKVDGTGSGESRRALDAESQAQLERSMLRWAIRMLSGPGGLASYLRTGLLDTALAGPRHRAGRGSGRESRPGSPRTPGATPRPALPVPRL